MLSELRYAIRSFLRTPGFTIAAVLKLAVGIRANTAIFRVVDAARATRVDPAVTLREN